MRPLPYEDDEVKLFYHRAHREIQVLEDAYGAVVQSFPVLLCVLCGERSSCYARSAKEGQQTAFALLAFLQLLFSDEGVMTKTVVMILAGVLLCQSSAEAQWRFAWRLDPQTQEYTCSASSGAQQVRTGLGDAESSVELCVQAEGRMMLQSDQVPFDRRALDAISINVDEHPAIARPEPGSDDRLMVFSEDDSNTLHRQFEAGASILITMVFSPKGQPVTRRFSLEGYPGTAAQYKGCRGLLLSSGWPGLHMTTAPIDPDQAAWLLNNTPYRQPGIVIVTVDPRKEAQKIDLRPGDLILGSNGQAVAEVGDLIRAMKALDPGKTIELDVLRGRTYLKRSLRRPVSSRSE